MSLAWNGGGPTFALMSRIHTRFAAFAFLAFLGGCVAAAAGAGAAGAGYYFTQHGVGSTVNAQVDDVAARTQEVFAQQGIEVTKTTDQPGADHRTFEGKKGELDVSVDIQREGDTQSKVEVSAKKSYVQYDKDYARTVMDRIVQSTTTARR